MRTYTRYRQATISALKAARKEAGISGRELSKKLGRPYNFVHFVETGQRELTFFGFIEYAHALGVDPAALVKRIVKS